MFDISRQIQPGCKVVEAQKKRISVFLMICSDNLLVKASVALFLVVVLPITNIYFWLVVRSLKRRLEMDDAIGYDENRIQVPKFSVTRFGQITQLWPNFEVFDKIFRAFIKYWRNFEPTLASLLCY